MRNKGLYMLLYILIIAFIVTLFSIGYQLLLDKENYILEGKNAEVGTYTVFLVLNGASGVDNNKLICYESANGDCVVHLPNARRNGGQVLGYSTNPNSHDANFLPDTDMTLEEAQTVIDRVLGIYRGEIPGNVEIWTKEGVLKH